MYVIVIVHEQRVIGPFYKRDDAQHWLNLRPQYDNMYRPVKLVDPSEDPIPRRQT